MVAGSITKGNGCCRAGSILDRKRYCLTAYKTTAGSNLISSSGICIDRSRIVGNCQFAVNILRIRKHAGANAILICQRRKLNDYGIFFYKSSTLLLRKKLRHLVFQSADLHDRIFQQAGAHAGHGFFQFFLPGVPNLQFFRGHIFRRLYGLRKIQAALFHQIIIQNIINGGLEIQHFFRPLRGGGRLCPRFRCGRSCNVDHAFCGRRRGSNSRRALRSGCRGFGTLLVGMIVGIALCGKDLAGQNAHYHNDHQQKRYQSSPQTRLHSITSLGMWFIAFAMVYYANCNYTSLSSVCQFFHHSFSGRSSLFLRKMPSFPNIYQYFTQYFPTFSKVTKKPSPRKEAFPYLPHKELKLRNNSFRIPSFA